MVQTSVYIDNSSASIAASQTWLSGNLNAIQLVGGIENWWDWSNSPSWIAQQVAGARVDIYWSIGLIPKGATLEDAAAGKYQAQYLALAKSMLASSAGQDKILINLGWEMNYPGWPWSVQGHEAAYVGAWQQFVTAFRSVSDKFVFEWTPQAGNPWADKTTDPTVVYPGDKYVDVIGLNFYNPSGQDPQTVFTWFVNAPHGLQWQQDFAAAHGKETAIGEWGVASDNAGPYIDLVAQWAKDHDMLYQNYWNSNAAFKGSLINGQYPTSGAVFQSIFGQETDPYASDLTPIVRTGGSGVDLLLGHGGNDTLSGGAGDDLLHGRGGNDVLDGGTGADLMFGGTGDDVYYVDNAGDKVIELQGEGNDTVYASVSFDLAGQFIETLTLTGTANINAYGNSQANTLNGNSGDNILDGRGGADLMAGGKGNDTYYVDNVGDKVIEFANEGYDRIYASVSYDLGGTFVEELRLTGAANLNATGNDLANALYGNDGNNILDGKAGADTMVGGKGDDVYYVDNAGDKVVELQNEGNDTVYASVSFDLAGQFIETLTLIGTANINAYGNSQANTLNGNGGDNILDGRGGADVMVGGKGNDTYYVDNVGDKVVEAWGEGNDTVYASVSYTLAATFVETMWLTGTANIDATGNSQANTLHGNSGNNVINGMGGDDILFGGGGNDRFVFAQTRNATIADFGVGDTLDLSALLKAGKQPTLTQTASGTLVTVDAATSILVEGIALSHLIKDSAGFHFA